LPPKMAVGFRRMRKPQAMKTMMFLDRKRGDAKRQEPANVDLGRGYAPDLTDDRLAELTREFGNDEALAKRIMALQEKFPNATLPELCCMDYLDRERFRYAFQAIVDGGWAQRGGLIPDFVVDCRGVGTAILVNGDYWHTRGEKEEDDAITRLRLMGAYTHGIEIDRVIFVWETRLMRNQTHTMDMAVIGVELGQ
jgi:hypothetical protein